MIEKAIKFVEDKLSNTAGKLLIPKEGTRKLVFCVWLIVSAVVFTATGTMSADQFVEFVKWVGGMFIGGNGVERVSSAMSAKANALLAKPE